MPAHLKQGSITWTSNIAYAVGLLTTDGNLSKDGRHIDFTSKEQKLIATFKNCLNLQNKIGKKIGGFKVPTIAYRVQFGNVVFLQMAKRNWVNAK